MYLAKQGGLVTSSTDTSSLAQYSNANSGLSAAAPSHAAKWLAPAQGSSSQALSPEAGKLCKMCCMPLVRTRRDSYGRTVSVPQVAEFS